MNKLKQLKTKNLSPIELWRKLTVWVSWAEFRQNNDRENGLKDADRTAASC